VTRPNHDLPVRRFFETVDLEKLDMFLEGNDKYMNFAAALRSAEYAHLTYAKIMEKFGITLHELNSLYRDGSRSIGLFAMSNHLPKIMEDVSVDAESKDIICPRCEGDKSIYVLDSKDPKNCPQCNGTGNIRQVGDKHARDLVFESMGLTSQRGPMVAIQQNFASKGAAGLNSSMEDMLRLTQTITMGERKDTE
jgi:hypothetical protein